MVIGLMMKWNSKCYHGLCGGCIWLWFRVFDRSSSQIEAETADYVQNNNSNIQIPGQSPGADTPETPVAAGAFED